MRTVQPRKRHGPGPLAIGAISAIVMVLVSRWVVFGHMVHEEGDLRDGLQIASILLGVATWGSVARWLQPHR